MEFSQLLKRIISFSVVLTLHNLILKNKSKEVISEFINCTSITTTFLNNPEVEKYGPYFAANQTALHIASIARNARIVSDLLLKYPDDMNIRNSKGKSLFKLILSDTIYSLL